MSSFDEEWEDEVLETEVEDKIVETKTEAEYEVLEKENIPTLEIDSLMYKLLVYILGRFNPVHDGHMATVMAAIELAKANGGKALILLGDGDKKTKGTIENPLDFEFKKEIMEGRIPGIYHEYYEIEQKTVNPVTHIRSFIERNQEDSKIPYIVHLTASKAAKEGEQSDADKLGFINKYLSSEFKETHSRAIKPINTNGIEMSATAVRTFAVRHDKDEFIKQYYGVYGEDVAGQVYDKINSAYEKSPALLKLKYAKHKPPHAKSNQSSVKHKPIPAKHKGGTRKRKDTNKRISGTRKHKRTNKRISTSGTRTSETRKRIYRSISK